jgi:hypothetical protein
MIDKFDTSGMGYADADDRITDTAYREEDSEIESGLRPHALDEYVGQEKEKEWEAGFPAGASGDSHLRCLVGDQQYGEQRDPE